MQEHRHTEVLPIGHHLDCYRIEAVLGQGGFGITYRAEDLKGTRRLAVKEYFPASAATRIQGVRVGPRRLVLQEEYDYGLQRFRKEAETLARFNHSNIVKVWRLLNVNDTAYIVMSFEEGETLARLLERHPNGLPEQAIVALFRGIVDGLSVVHETGHLHRDLAPDNIIIRRDDVPVIVDFGAARCSYGQKSRSLEAIIKRGYSPPEQYMVEHSRQGLWTDIYALGAIAYRCIGGPTPPASLDRQSAAVNGQPDPMVAAASIGRGRYSPALLNAVQTALLLPPQQRPLSAAAWYGMFAHAPRRPLREKPRPEQNPAKHSDPGFLRKLFGLGREQTASTSARCWILTGTDSSGGSVRVEISERTLQRSQGRLVIGRDEAQSTVRIPDVTVSRRHALLSLDDRGLLIEDINSSNGTWVNGTQLKPSLKPVPLAGSTRITLGGVNLVVLVGRGGRETP